MAIIEAQAAGTPCVISPAVSSEAVVTNAVTHVPIDNAEAWADTLAQVLRSTPNRAQTARDVCDAGYDIDDVAAWLAHFYERLATRTSLKAGA